MPTESLTFHTLWTRLAMVLLSCCALNAAVAQTGDVTRVHDPCIAKCGNSYYIFSTGAGIPIRQSPDLVTWRCVGTVFPDTPAWAKEAVPGVKDLWAPDIAFFSGEYHLYYSASTFGSKFSRIGVATNKTLDPASPDYKWVDHGVVVASGEHTDYNAIDSNIAFDDSGQPWLAFGSYWNGIRICRVNRLTGKPVSSNNPLIAIASRDGGAVEASFIVKKGSYYYLFVSFEQCCQGVRSAYKIMVGRSKKITGPYKDLSGRPMMQGGGTPLLEGYGRVRGPGHNAVLLNAAGGDWLVHHFYDADNGGTATLQIRSLIWTETGWPLAGEPLPQAQAMANLSVTGKWKHFVGGEPAVDVTFLDGGHIDQPDSTATWTLNHNKLILRWPAAKTKSGGWLDECIVSPDGRWYVGRNQAGAVIRGIRTE